LRVIYNVWAIPPENFKSFFIILKKEKVLGEMVKNPENLKRATRKNYI